MESNRLAEDNLKVAQEAKRNETDAKQRVKTIKQEIKDAKKRQKEAEKTAKIATKEANAKKKQADQAKKVIKLTILLLSYNHALIISFSSIKFFNNRFTTLRRQKLRIKMRRTPQNS
jgi:hypothetical protein